MPVFPKPYLKKFFVMGKFTVWLVDGSYVRRNMDEEFTNFGQHYRFSCIPMWEFWIDKEFSPGEEWYFIDHLLLEHTMMREGMSYADAITAGGRLEQKERAKSKLMQTISKEKREHSPHLYTHIHKKKWNLYKAPGLTIWIVNGEAVRDLFFIDFTCGGHNEVYHFVPKNEIWIDDDMQPKERKFVLLHELHERARMKKGWVYPKAHFEASKIELYCRHFPKKIGEKIREELLRQ